MRRALWTLAWAALVTLVAVGIATWQHLPIWPTVLIALGAIIANGLFATLEDDLPGGFNNPGGSHTPRYVTAVTYVVRTLGIIAALLILGALWLRFFGTH